MAGKSIDDRLKLTPRDYVLNDHDFGKNSEAIFLTPVGGDDHSCAVARGQHTLVLAWEEARHWHGTEDAAAFGMSSSTWNRYTSGEYWIGATAMSAMLKHLDLKPASDVPTD